jgi:hypothetical protein
MTIPEFLLSIAAGAVFALQGWMMLAIVNLKTDVAAMKVTLELIKEKML